MTGPAALQFVPELALSDHSSDLDQDVAYGQVEDTPWLSDDEGGKGGGYGVASGGTADGPDGLIAWDSAGWDDTALFQAFQAAKEEFLVYNDPIAPYTPYKVPTDLKERAREKGKNSWKVRLELKEAQAREGKDALAGPVGSCVHRSTLWYSTIGAQPSLKQAPNPDSKRSRSKAAKLKREAAKAASAPALVSPYDMPASKKRKQPEHSNPVEEPPTPEYTPMSPSFSPAHTPLSPSLSAVPDFPLDGPLPEEYEYEEEGGDGDADWAADDSVQLDPSQWDDSTLVQTWEEEEEAFKALHGTGKSWLTLAMEAQALGVPVDVYIATLAAAKEATSEASGPTRNDKVAERHMKRFEAVRGASGGGSGPTPETDVAELSYD